MLRRVRFYQMLFVGAASLAVGSGYAVDGRMTNLASALNAMSWVLLVLGFLQASDS